MCRCRPVEGLMGAHVLFGRIAAIESSPHISSGPVSRMCKSVTRHCKWRRPNNQLIHSGYVCILLNYFHHGSGLGRVCIQRAELEITSNISTITRTVKK